MASLTQRMLGAAKLDAATYEEVEADTTGHPAGHAGRGASPAWRQAWARSGAVGVGGLLRWRPSLRCIGWYVWAFITYFVGTRSPARAEDGRRTSGSSCGPSASPPLRA